VASEQSRGSRGSTAGGGGVSATSGPAGKEIDRQAGGGGAGPLQSSNGSTTINDAVVTKVAGIAAREVPGVHALGGGAGRAFSSVSAAIGVGDQRGQGVSVEVGEQEAAVDLTLTVDYGESIPQVTNAIRENVMKRVEGITGLKVTEVNIAVNDLYFPGDDQPQQPQPQG
jgi:uncharacterized alkaline shock family protein YloU